MKSIPKFGVELYEGKLKNGSPVFLFYRKGMPISLRANFFSGSRFDNIPGTSHFLEHLIVAGSKKFPSKNLIADYIQRVGGDFAARTNNNSLILDTEVADKSDLYVAVEVMDQCLTQPLFDLKTIETERGSILSELNDKKSNPKNYIWEVTRRISLQNLSVGRSTLGDVDTINSIKKEDILSFYNHFITSGRATFFASGDIDFGELLNALEKIELKNDERFNFSEILPVITEKLIDIENYPELKQLQATLTCRITPIDYREYCSLSVLNAILSNGRGSRLMTKLRYENGLVYSVSGFIMNGPDWEILGIQFSCDKDKWNDVNRIIFDEFDLLQKENISIDELTNTKNRIIKGLTRNLQTSRAWIDFHEYQAVFFPDSFKTIEDYIKTIDSLTLEDIRKVIKKYLKKENFFTAVCGNLSN